MDVNPYVSPIKTPDCIPVRSGILSSRARKIAVGILLTSIALAILIRVWAFYFAGDWFLSTDRPPDDRAKELHYASLTFIALVVGIAVFPAILLLFLDRYRPLITGLLIVPTFICFVASILVVAAMAYY